MDNGHLEAGLAALKQGDYQAAIDHLETYTRVGAIRESPLPKPQLWRAQMGLVAAYQGNGNLEKAASLCQTLTQSENEKVRAWAVRTQEKLPPPPPATDPTGFIPLDTADPTGFIPLDAPPLARDSGGRRGNPPVVAPISPSPRLPLPPPPPPPVGTMKDGAKAQLQTKDGAKAQLQTKDGAKAQLQTKDGAKAQLQTKGGAEAPLRTPPRPPVPPSPRPPVSGSPRPQVGELALSEVEGRSRTAVPPSPPPPVSGSPQWRQAGRAKNWPAMKTPNLQWLRLSQGVTVLTLFWMMRGFIQFVLFQLNESFLSKIPFGRPFQPFYQDQTWPIFGVFFLAFAASPWLMDVLLTKCYGMTASSVKELGEKSPEAARLLRRFCFERHIPEFKVGLLPTNAPVAMSYGCLPRFARIVVSSGLLEKLEADEIAAICAGEVAHIANWEFSIMTLAVLLCQLPYLIYWQAAEEGDKWQSQSSINSKVMFLGAGVMAAAAYGGFWLLRWPVLWLSRLRLYYSDRAAAALTGNPNGLARGLLKTAVGIAAEVRQTGGTSWLLEGLEMLMPLGYRQGITLGSLQGYGSWETMLAWDVTNPYRRWLAINNSHPPTGERLRLLGVYAKFWKLETELDFAPLDAAKPQFQWDPLLLQGAPFFGLPIGLAIGYGIWLVGAISGAVGVWELEWLWGDRSLLAGCLPLGISLGTFSRINQFFPDITPERLASATLLPELIVSPQLLPTDSQPQSLQGKLLGRRGISNWLAQDLILDTPTGLIKLHCCSHLGPLGYLWPFRVRPLDFIGQSVTVTGWFRRGATPWLDVETLQTRGETGPKVIFKSHHPITATTIAAVTAIWGAYLIYSGSIR